MDLTICRVMGWTLAELDATPAQLYPHLVRYVTGCVG